MSAHPVARHKDGSTDAAEEVLYAVLGQVIQLGNSDTVECHYDERLPEERVNLHGP